MLGMVAFSPHPPIAVKEVGGKETGKIAATVKSLNDLALEIADFNPEVIAVITPHGHVFSDGITLTALDVLQGDLGGFGAPGVTVQLSLDREAVQTIEAFSRDRSLPCFALDSDDLKRYRLSHKLDHGQVVPLSFIVSRGWKGKLVPVNMGMLPFEELYEFGTALREAMDSLERNWVLLVSGDLSHRLLPEAPAGYSPRGAVFDEIIRQAVGEGDVRRLINLDPELIEEAGECGLRPLIMGFGALDGYEILSQVLSYEGPFGVGYLVARMTPGRKMPERRLTADLYRERKNKLERRRAKESPLVRLARHSIEHYLEKGTVPEVPGEFLDSLSPSEKALLRQKAGAFVSLKKHGQLRGCIGTIEPTKSALALEVIHNAISAAVNDPRFFPLEAEELPDLTISVDVLEKPEQIESTAFLDPKRYGVIVTAGDRRGLLLPDLPGVDSVEEQVRIAREKAGINPSEKVRLERFMVTRYY